MRISSSTSVLRPRIAVLGGGITGLAAAWHLRRLGCEPTVLEKSGRIGGAIQSVRMDGWLHELGPNSLMEGSAAVAELIDGVGLGSQRVHASPAARSRYIVKDGRLVAMPTSPVAFALTRLFSLRAKLALLGEPWRPAAPPDADENVASFVRRRLGGEFLDYAVNPFVGGVYAGDPECLSVKHGFPKLHRLEQECGSLLRGALKRRNASGGPKGGIYSFLRGLGALPEALASSLGPAVRLNTSVHSIARGARGWQVEYETGGRRMTESFEGIVSALPGDALARLDFKGPAQPVRLAALSEVNHPPVTSVLLGFRRDQIRHPLDGFGALAPAVEHRNILGCLFSSTLFPDRAPPGHVALTVFVGGTRSPQLTTFPDQGLVDLIAVELEALVGLRGDPVFTHIQRWSRAIPQYNVGYQRYKDLIATAETESPGLFVGGNVCDGISLAHCIESGLRLATRAANFAQAV